MSVRIAPARLRLLAPVSLRLPSGRVRGRDAVHPFLEKLGPSAVLGVLSSGPERCYDTIAVALCGVFALALGTSSLEG